MVEITITFFKGEWCHVVSNGNTEIHLLKASFEELEKFLDDTTINVFMIPSYKEEIRNEFKIKMEGLK